MTEFFLTSRRSLELQTSEIEFITNGENQHSSAAEAYFGENIKDGA